MGAGEGEGGEEEEGGGSTATEEESRRATSNAVVDVATRLANACSILQSESKRGKLDPSKLEAALSNLASSTDLSSVAKCDLVVELARRKGTKR